MNNNTFICILCKQKSQFYSVDHLEAHIAEWHMLSLPFSCTLCEFGGRFPTETAIVTHLKQCHQVEDEFRFFTIFNKDTIEKRKKIGEILHQCISLNGKKDSSSFGEQNQHNSETSTQITVVNNTLEDEPATELQTIQSSLNKKKGPHIAAEFEECSNNNNSTVDISITTSFARPLHDPVLSQSQPKPAKIPRLSLTPPAATVLTAAQRTTSVAATVITQTTPEVAASTVTATNNNCLVSNTAFQAPLPSIISKALQGGSNDLAKNSQHEKKQQKASANNNNNTSSGHEKEKSSQKRTKEKERKSSEREKKAVETAAKGGYNDVSIDHLFMEMNHKNEAQHVNVADDDEHSEEGEVSAKEDLPKISKSIPRHGLEAPSFFATKPSSKLGLVLHKAESEGRDYQRRKHQANNNADGVCLESYVRSQDEMANKWHERNQDREIREDLNRKIQERDKQLRERKESQKL